MITTNPDTVAGLTCRELRAEDYHADPAIGASMLEDFRESRRLYEGRYITKTIPPREPSDAMILGTHIHTRLLEPDRYFEMLADPLPEVAPDGKKWHRRAGSDHYRWWADELAAREGKIAIDQFTRDRIEAVATSVLSKPWAKPLLAGAGEPEYSIFWTDEETGLHLKCRVDWFANICIDIKTTFDPSPSQYAKTLVSLGYARKMAHYRAGIAARTEREARFVHIAIGTSPPYAAGAYSVDDRDYQDFRNPRLGEKQWRRTLRELAECKASGDYSDPFEREIIELRLPAFAFTEDQWR